MASGGKGGSTSSSVTIPDWIKEPATRNLARAEQAAQVGYMPWYGPDVAALSPQQLQSMQSTQSAGEAFGLAAPGSFSTGLPQAQTFSGGVQGYSSAPLFNQAVADLAANNPGQYNRYNSLYNGQYLSQNPTTVNQYNVPASAVNSSGASGGYSPADVGSNPSSMNWGDPFAGGVTATSSPGLLGSIGNTAALGSAVIGNVLGIDALSGQNSGNMAPVVDLSPGGSSNSWGGYGEGTGGTSYGDSSDSGYSSDAGYSGGGGWSSSDYGGGWGGY
jgi:hypothetical protein